MRSTTGRPKVSSPGLSLTNICSGALIVYDITDKDSFGKVATWYVELKKYLDASTPIIIAGNKCDITNRAVELEEAEAYSKSVGCEHFSTSAKSGHNVKAVFTQLARSKLQFSL